jgi:hypothetical protein
MALDNVIGKTGLGRIDEGVDFSGRGPVRAVGSGPITYVTTASGWPGGTFITQDIGGGRYVYYAENIRPTVHQGQVVRAGDQIGYAPGTYPYIEVGWAAGPTGALAKAHGHYTEGEATAEGKDFYNFLFHGGGHLGGGGGGGGVGGFLSDPIGTIVNDIAGEGLRILLYVVLVIGGIALAGLGAVHAAGSRAQEAPA